MKKIFSYLNNMSKIASITVFSTTIFSILILLALLPIRFLFFQGHVLVYYAQYAICVAVALFSEGLIFSCIMNSKSKKS